MRPPPSSSKDKNKDNPPDKPANDNDNKEPAKPARKPRKFSSLAAIADAFHRRRSDKDPYPTLTPSGIASTTALTDTLTLTNTIANANINISRASLAARGEKGKTNTSTSTSHVPAPSRIPTPVAKPRKLSPHSLGVAAGATRLEEIFGKGAADEIIADEIPRHETKKNGGATLTIHNGGVDWDAFESESEVEENKIKIQEASEMKKGASTKRITFASPTQSSVARGEGKGGRAHGKGLAPPVRSDGEGRRARGKGLYTRVGGDGEDLDTSESEREDFRLKYQRKMGFLREMDEMKKDMAKRRVEFSSPTETSTAHGEDKGRRGDVKRAATPAYGDGNIWESSESEGEARRRKIREANEMKIEFGPPLKRIAAHGGRVEEKGRADTSHGDDKGVGGDGKGRAATSSGDGKSWGPGQGGDESERGKIKTREAYEMRIEVSKWSSSTPSTSSSPTTSSAAFGDGKGRLATPCGDGKGGRGEGRRRAAVSYDARKRWGMVEAKPSQIKSQQAGEIKKETLTRMPLSTPTQSTMLKRREKMGRKKEGLTSENFSRPVINPATVAPGSQHGRGQGQGLRLREEMSGDSGMGMRGKNVGASQVGEAPGALQDRLVKGGVGYEGCYVLPRTPPPVPVSMPAKVPGAGAGKEPETASGPEPKTKPRLPKKYKSTAGLTISRPVLQSSSVMSLPEAVSTAGPAGEDVDGISFPPLEPMDLCPDPNADPRMVGFCSLH